MPVPRNAEIGEGISSLALAITKLAEQLTLLLKYRIQKQMHLFTLNMNTGTTSFQMQN